MTNRAALLAGAVALFTSAAIPVLSQPAGNDPPLPSARADGDVDVNSGRSLALGGTYGELRLDCVRCHELDGSGNSSGAFPRLTDQSAWYLYKSLLDYAAGLRPSDIMQPIARMLTTEEMENLAAYYASVEDAAYPAEPEPDVQVLQHGGAIAAVGIPDQGVPACENCHGPNGIGQPPIYPYLAGQFAPYLENQLILWKAGRRDGDAMNVMELIAKNMTDEQIRAVSVYFASVRPPEVTPDEGGYLSPEAASRPPARWTGRTDMGAVQDPVPGAATVVPGAEAGPGPAPPVELPVGLPRRPLPPDALPPPLSPPPAGEGLDDTVTTTGQQPSGEGDPDPGGAEPGNRNESPGR